MTDHLLLLAPSSNRVYASAADTLAAAELAVTCPDLDPELITPETVAGVSYLAIDTEDTDVLLPAVSTLSARLALFRREEGLLRPVEVGDPYLFDEDLLTIPKYQGKTNEQFTRLMVNATLAAVQREADGPRRILDPLCGRGTTLSAGLMLGHEVAGVDGDLKAVEAHAAFLKTYLRRKRLKHTVAMTPVKRDGKSVGRRLDATITPADAPTDRDPLALTVMSGDTRQSAKLYGKKRFDAVVTDAPYGVVHGSRTDVRGVSGKRDRSPAGLLGEAVSVWAGQLKSGGALGIAWNTYGLSREELCTIAAEAGLVPCNDGPWLQFGHRVDSAIHRDLFVAVKPTDLGRAGTPQVDVD